MSERSIFLSALDISEPAERSAYLAQACGNNANLRRHIEELIAAEAKLGGFLARPHAEVERTDDFAPAVERPGTQIGPYKLREQIGEGGFGVVYVAEQEKPVRRKVALKIIKPGMDTKDVIARFEAERQALALMDHPNVARVLDAGATDSGRPYFVMELVHGVPITEFCDKEKLPTRDRLLLFADVCRAVQHAHQKGIIHRDLKPSNIMVTLHDGKPVAKVIDFGVSKALSQQLTEKSIYTAYGQMIGTPSYMSPEQAEMSGLGIDTRSDIYSLGVLLYELLTGKTPLDAKRLREGGYAEMLRMIRDEEPPRPSLKISTLGEEATTIAQHRHTDPHQLRRSLRGELDWIVMKCLEKDRSRRYETAIGLARDVERYLQNETVEACPPSAAYRLRKFAGKHKMSLAVATAFVGLLLAAVAVSTWQRNVALGAKEAEAKERGRAEANAKAARDNQQIANQERDAANRERNNVLAAREEARFTLYAAAMNLVPVGWENRKYAQVAQLLDQQRPAAGQSDLRGFEWHYWHRKLHRGRLRSVKVPQLAKTDYSTRSAIGFSRGGARLAAVLPTPGDSSRTQGFGLLAVVDGATGHELFTPLNPFPGWQDEGRGGRLLSMSNDGTRLAVALARPTGGSFINGSIINTDQQLDRISIRDGGTGSEINSLESPGLISKIALTPDGRRLAVAYSERGTSGVLGVKVWDTSSGDLIQTLPMLPLGLTPICWSPDGTRLVRQHQIEAGKTLSDAVQQFQVVDVMSGKELWQRTIRNVGDSLNRTWSWSPDGKLLVVAVSGSVETKPSVQLWDSDTGKTLAILYREVESPIDDATIDLSPDGKLLAVVSGANEIYLWEVPMLPLAAGSSPLRIAAPHLTLQAAGEEIRALAFSADGRTLNSASGSSIIVWDATAREDIGTGPDSLRFFGSTGSASSMSRMVDISRDATKVAFIGPQEFGVWDLAGNRELWRLKSESPSGAWPSRPVFSPDGKRVALFRRAMEESGCQIVFHEVQTGVEVQRIALDKSALTIFGMPIFRPDGRQIAAMIIPQQPQENVARRRLMWWDVVTQKPLFSVNLNENVRERIVAYLLGYSPDGASVVVGHWDASNQQEGGVVFYDAATGELQRSIPVPSSLRPWWIDFTGQTIGAVGRADTSMGGIVANAIGTADIVLLDLVTGQERLRLRGHDGFDHYALSPDGSRLALGKQPPPRIRGQSELSLWSLKSGQRLLTLKREGSFRALSFSPDGNRLVAAFSGRTTDGIKPIQIWDATPLPEEDAK